MQKKFAERDRAKPFKMIYAFKKIVTQGGYIESPSLLIYVYLMRRPMQMIFLKDILVLIWKPVEGIKKLA